MLGKTLIKALLALLVSGAAALAQAPAEFELREGGAVDIGDRGVMLMYQYGTTNSFGEKTLILSISGNTGGFKVGQTSDLKRQGTGDALKDRAKCSLEFLDLTTPKGAPPTARFRLDCGGLAAKPITGDAKVVASTSGPAKLAPVKEGLARLAPGQSMPLGEGMPATVVYLGGQVQRGTQDLPYAMINVAGEQLRARPGERVDVRRYGRRNQALANKDVCFVDVVDIMPDGSSAVLRTFCL